ncbi:MAG: glycoside hydrolase family protein [Magnetococcales bacterium]|nr:glycoside hydrolase family protein [Magnetococcales bacterium]
MNAAQFGTAVGSLVNLERMRDQLIAHEGLRLKAYRCTADKLTIGVGYNIDAHGVPFGMTLDQIMVNGITRDQAMTLLTNGINDCIQALTGALPWWKSLDEIRRRVLIDMCFNLGINGLCGFYTTLGHVQAGRYDQAATAMLDSRWAKQVGNRANRLSQMMRTGQEL